MITNHKQILLLIISMSFSPGAFALDKGVVETTEEVIRAADRGEMDYVNLYNALPLQEACHNLKLTDMGNKIINILSPKGEWSKLPLTEAGIDELLMSYPFSVPLLDCSNYGSVKSYDMDQKEHLNTLYAYLNNRELELLRIIVAYKRSPSTTKDEETELAIQELTDKMTGVATVGEAVHYLYIMARP